VTHGNLTSFEWVVLSRWADGRDEVVGILFLWAGHFQKDGATAHTANESMIIVRNMFPGHLISRFGDVLWPHRSPDLSKCDFFLWGYLKSRAYTHKPRTLSDLKEAIRQEILPLYRQLLARVMDDFKKRLENYIKEDGRHLTDIIFET